MPYLVKNTFLDKTKTHRHRIAPKLQVEPVIGGKKLKLRSQIVLTDDEHAASEKLIKELEAAGVLECCPFKQATPEQLSEEASQPVPPQEETPAAIEEATVEVPDAVEEAKEEEPKVEEPAPVEEPKKKKRRGRPKKKDS